MNSDVSAHNDRRSAHNALERQRREHLNVKFQQLAHALPSLQTVRRPSKTMIVAKSLEFGKKPLLGIIIDNHPRFTKYFLYSLFKFKKRIYLYI